MTVNTLAPAAGAVVPTCLLHGDAAALEEVLPTLPAYPLILEDLAGLLWFTAKASLSMNLGRLADEGTLRCAWRDSRDQVAAQLQLTHRFTDAELDAPLGWADSIILEGRPWWIPGHDQAVHVAVISALVAELVSTWTPGEWADLLACRERVPR